MITKNMIYSLFSEEGCLVTGNDIEMALDVYQKAVLRAGYTKNGGIKTSGIPYLINGDYMHRDEEQCYRRKLLVRRQVRGLQHAAHINVTFTRYVVKTK